MPVTFVERIGARTIVHLGEGETAVKAVFDNDVGLPIGADRRSSRRTRPRCALFDAASGQAIGAE